MKKIEEKAAAVYFIGLGAIMYYAMDQVILIPYTIPIKQLVVVLIIFSCLICFLIRPNIARGAVALRSALVFAAPMFVMVTVSLPIWFARRVSMLELYRVLWTYVFYVNQILAALVAAAFLYLFGERGIWYQLISVLVANLAWILGIMLENGVGAYLSELLRLIVTFAGETGEIIGKAEVHEIAFCIGAYIVYMVLHYKRDFLWNCLLALSVFCFLSAFKRIAIGAVVIAIGAGILLKWIAGRGKEHITRKIINIVFGIVIAFLIGYIAFIKAGGFHYLEELGLDTMSRADIYDEVDGFYEFSPDFMGYGMGFLFYELTRKLELWENAIHNDYLQFYIDLGFWGYIIWLFSLTFLRTMFFGRKGRMEDRINTFVIMCYVLILSATDNTMNFQMLYTTGGILIMGNTFNSQTADMDRKLFGYVEEQNRMQKDGNEKPYLHGRK